MALTRIRNVGFLLGAVTVLACTPDSSSVSSRTARHAQALSSSGIWSGTLTYELRRNVSESEGNGSKGWPFYSSQHEIRHVATVHVNRNRARMTADYFEHYASHRSWSEPVPPCSFDHRSTITATGSGSVDATFDVVFNDDGTYELGADFDGDPPTAHSVLVERYVECGGVTSSSEDEDLTIGQIFDLYGDGAASDRELSGTMLDPNNDANETTVWRWNLVAEEEDVELLVAVQDYDTWRPTAHSNPASKFEVGVLLQTADGKVPSVRLSSATFELVDVSHVPGTSMNVPIDGLAYTEADLDFDPENEAAGVAVGGAERDVAVAPASEDGTRASVLVRSHDWGGWATLKVSAELTDGRKIRGKLYDTGETEIRLPKSRPGSHVAAGWLEGRGVYQPDDADDDAQPEGDGHGGDGLTLYEEYRGFQVGDDRVEGDPLVKDLFVLIADPRVKEVEAGLAMYEQGTGINVHTGFGKSQLWMGSMNFNQDGTTPHRVDQHIVTVDKGWDTTRSYVEVVGTPRVCRNVWMLPSLEEHALDADGNRITRREFASTVAHEVSHCSMVAHHGPKKYRVVRWKRGSDGNIYEIDEGGGSTAITVMKEVNSTVPATSHLFNQSFRLAVDETGGQASGDDQCWMRYDNSAAYVSTTSASTRYYIGLQPSGHELCSASVGTGMNSKDHLPQSRFGDAPRGNCAAQLCINDAFANDPTHTR